MLIFEEQLFVEIPDTFKEMEECKVSIMYPYEEKPQIMLEDEQMHRFCTFSLLVFQGLAEAQVESAIHSVCNTVRSLHPSCLLETPQLMKCSEGTCGWFSFRTEGTEGRLYNVMYVFPVNGNMMLGSMGCPMEDEPGKQLLMQAMESLKSLRENI